MIFQFKDEQPPLQLIKIRSTWEPDSMWIGDFSDDSEEWDKH